MEKCIKPYSTQLEVGMGNIPVWKEYSTLLQVTHDICQLMSLGLWWEEKLCRGSGTYQILSKLRVVLITVTYVESHFFVVRLSQVPLTQFICSKKKRKKLWILWLKDKCLNIWSHFFHNYYLPVIHCLFCGWDTPWLEISHGPPHKLE